jgi:hypothetical protein
MNWVEIVTLLSSVVTAVGVIIAALQIRLAMKQSKTAFEDGLSSEYRQIVASLPIAVFLGEKLDKETLEKSLPVFFQYFHLSNSQAYMRARRRISARTWQLWSVSIRSNMSMPAFQQAWQVFESVHENRHLVFLKRLHDNNYGEPRMDWLWPSLPDHNPAL